MSTKVICLMMLCLANSATCTISVFTEFNYLMEKFEAVPSEFGNPLPKEGLDGLVVYADAADSCKSIRSKRPKLPDYNGKWILLIPRLFDCLFEDQVRMAQNAGFDGVIIHNKDSDSLITMVALNPNRISIPSVFVTESDGNTIKNCYCNSHYYININDEVSIDPNALLKFSLFAFMGIFFAIAAALAYFLYGFSNPPQYRYEEIEYVVFSNKNNSLL